MSAGAEKFWCPRCGEPDCREIDRPVCDVCESEIDAEAERDRRDRQQIDDDTREKP
jgi:hypothetical protein